MNFVSLAVPQTSREIRGTLSATNPVALVPDLSIRKVVFCVLRSGTSATGFVAERVPHCTEMVKKMGPKLREFAPAARGSQEAGSRNLGPASLTISVFLDVPSCVESGDFGGFLRPVDPIDFGVFRSPFGAEVWRCDRCDAAVSATEAEEAEQTANDLWNSKASAWVSLTMSNITERKGLNNLFILRPSNASFSCQYLAATHSFVFSSSHLEVRHSGRGIRMMVSFP